MAVFFWRAPYLRPGRVAQAAGGVSTRVSPVVLVGGCPTGAHYCKHGELPMGC